MRKTKKVSRGDAPTDVGSKNLTAESPEAVYVFKMFLREAVID